MKERLKKLKKNLNTLRKSNAYNTEIAELNKNTLDVQISVPTSISVHDIRTENDDEDILKFILGLDLSVATVDFTLKLILELANSCRHDISQEDFEELGREIAGIKSEIK